MPRITLQDRCLLYLLDRAGLGPADAGAEELLQHRIGAAFGAQRGHVSRAMASLARRGLVRETRIRAPGEKRRRLGYLPTDEGVRAAKRVRERVEAMRVTVVDSAGGESLRPLHEVPALLPRKMRFSELVAAMRRGRIDLRDLPELKGRVERGRVHDVRGAIESPHFRGRGATLARLDAFLADPGARGLLLAGLPGVGKTAAASRWVEGLRGRHHVLWRRLAGTTEADLLRDLAALLRTAGRPALWDRLHRPADAPGEDLRILLRDIARTPAVLVFDDVHAADGGAAALVAGLLRADADGLKIVLLGRHAPPFLAAEDVARGWVWRETLDDLPPEEADAVLAAMAVEPARRGEILARCGGHPMSLELAARGGMPLDAVRRTSADWVADAVLAQLGGDDRKALALAAVFEDAVPASLLGASAHRLAERCLLRDAGDGRLGIHDLVRDGILRDRSDAEIADLRLRAGAALARSPDPRDALAALRQYVAAGAVPEAGALAAARGVELVDAGFAASLVPLVEQLARASPASGDPARTDLLLGHALSALGRWRDAAHAYEGCESSEDARVAAEGLLGRGKAEYQRASRLALPLLDAARDRLEGLGALRLLAEAQYWTGCVHEAASRLDRAQEAFERGRAIAYDVGDRRWEGMCVYGAGRVRSRRKQYGRAVDEEGNALRLLERDGARLEVAKVCAGLGGNLYELGRLADAEVYLDRSVREARATGATSILASALYNLAGVRAKAGRHAEALPLLEEALRIYEEHEQFAAAADAASYHAAYAAKIGLPAVPDASFRRARALVARIADPGQRAVALHGLGDAERQAGRARDAGRDLRRAVAEARGAGLSELASRLSADLRAPPTPSRTSRARTSGRPPRRGTPPRRRSRT